MTDSGLSVGLLVNHKTWGLGKVLHLERQDVWVYFKDVEGAPKDAVKKLKRRVAVLTAAERQADPALDNLPPMVRDGRVEPPDALRITERQGGEHVRREVPAIRRSELPKVRTTAGTLSRSPRRFRAHWSTLQRR